MEYEFTFRSVLRQPLPAGLSFTPFDFKMREPAVLLPDRRFPRLDCYCDSNRTVWILIDIDRLMAFPEPDRMLIARRR
jgi:hypothetical protein